MMLAKGNLIQLERLSEQWIAQPRQVESLLHYPLHTLQQTQMKSPFNVLIIVVDAWRFDMLNKTVMPYSAQFAQSAWMFTQHFSGGNATGPGIFSLFYGVPAAYWTAMEEQHQSPVFINALLKHHYHIGIFSSAALNLPAFNQTVFQAIPHLQIKTPGETPYVRDQAITQEFRQFIASINHAKDSSPFFGFLFYDFAHSYCRDDSDLLPLQPAIKVCDRYHLDNQSNPLPYLNRYKNALLLVDQQIKQVVDTLQEANLLDKTVIIITGDHGEEFNDNHLNYWGHASNFTRYQTQTPLIVYWPGSKPHVFSHTTSHFDISPTLMRRLLGEQSLPTNYSVGKDLLDKTDRFYLIMDSYINLGVITQNQIATLFPGGRYEITALNASPLWKEKLNISVMQQVFRDLRRFYQ
jgi:membrane-anchored protein YejM (alkaline phosphatase superfamily)